VDWFALALVQKMPEILASVIPSSWAISVARIPSLTIEAQHPTAQIEHEATTSKIGEDQIVLLQPAWDWY
jgi:hypothetical protein